MRLSSSFLHVAAPALVLLASGCSDKDADRFLNPLKHADYDAAFAELHPKARELTPNSAAMKASFEQSGVKLLDWSWTCSSSNTSRKLVGYNVTTQRGRGATKGAVVIGVQPEKMGKCNAGLLLHFEKDESLPGRPWKVVGMKID